MKQAPKAFCAQCGTYIGHRWGVLQQKVYYCTKCLRIIRPKQELSDKQKDIPF